MTLGEKKEKFLSVWKNCSSIQFSHSSFSYYYITKGKKNINKKEKKNFQTSFNFLVFNEENEKFLFFYSIFLSFFLWFCFVVVAHTFFFMWKVNKKLLIKYWSCFFCSYHTEEVFLFILRLIVFFLFLIWPDWNWKSYRYVS